MRWQFIRATVSFCLSCIIAGLLLLGCSLHPSTANGKQVIQDQIAKDSAGRIRLLTFQKTNALKREEFGVKKYDMEFEVEIEFTESCKWVIKPFEQQLSFITSKPLPESQSAVMKLFDEVANSGALVRKGERAQLSGIIHFVKMENGWTVGYMELSKFNIGKPTKGDVSFVLKIDVTSIDPAARAEAINQAQEILKRRMKQIGVSKLMVNSIGKDQIQLQLFGLDENTMKVVRRAIEQSGHLEFRLVHAKNDQLQAESSSPYFHPPVGYTNLVQNIKGTEGQGNLTRRYFCKPTSENDMTGKYIERVSITSDSIGRPQIWLIFSQEGTASLGRITGSNIGQQLAIIINGEVQSVPVIRNAILDGRMEILGNFGTSEAKQLVSVLENPLATPIKIIEE